MQVSDQTILEGYKDRIRRLAVFDPLYRLENKKTKDQAGNPIDYFGLGLISLLFFFENMLLRNNKTSTIDLMEFLGRQVNGRVALGQEDIEKIARDIVAEFRPPGGKKNSKVFFNWETGHSEQIHYSILKASGYDPITNIQYYVLDDDGLELIFATREYYAEFSLSINQLLLRKQLEKGEFVSALRQIDEMRMDVANLHDRIVKIHHDIQRSIVSDETYHRFRSVVDDLNSRMSRENDEFSELRNFVKDTKSRHQYDLQGEKERKAYGLILEIDQKLAEVHYNHTELFQDGIELKTTALRAAQQSLYHVGLDSFNFREQLTGRLLSEPLPLQSSRVLAEPFLYLEQVRSWSPLSVFGRQRIEKGEDFNGSDAFPEYDTNQSLSDYRLGMAGNFKIIMALLLQMADECQSFTESDEAHFELKDFIPWLQKTHPEAMVLLEDRSFYDFWILVHQKSPLSAEDGSSDQGSSESEGAARPLLEEAACILAQKHLWMRVTDGKGVLKPGNRFSIRNLNITMKSKEK